MGWLIYGNISRCVHTSPNLLEDNVVSSRMLLLNAQLGWKFLTVWKYSGENLSCKCDAEAFLSLSSGFPLSAGKVAQLLLIGTVLHVNNVSKLVQVAALSYANTGSKTNYKQFSITPLFTSLLKDFLIISGCSGIPDSAGVEMGRLQKCCVSVYVVRRCVYNEV